jgi:hypothetical protein
MTRCKTLCAASVLALAATQALAQAEKYPVAGTLQVGYQDESQSGQRTNDWDALGSAVFTSGGLNVQLDASKDDLRVPRLTTATEALTAKGGLIETATSQSARGMQWRYGGDVFWRDGVGIIGANVEAAHTTTDAFTAIVVTPPGGAPARTLTQSESTFENAGLFGEYFVLSDLSLRGKGGFIFGDRNGGYGGVSLAFYPVTEIAMTVGPDYTDLGHGLTEEDAAAGIEYLPFPDAPITLNVGYTYARFRGIARGEDGNIFSVALKAYLGARGENLRDYQRNGTVAGDGVAPALAHLGL